MIQSITLCHVELVNIDFSDTRFDLYPLQMFSTDYLSSEEIQIQSLFSPPLLAVRDKSYTPVSGQALLRLAVQRKIHKIPVLLLDLEKINHHDFFKVLLQHRQHQAPLTPMDQAVFLHKALAHISRKNLLTFLPAMGLKKNAHTLTELLAFLELERNTQQAIHQGIVAPKNGRRLLYFSKSDQKALTRIIKKFQFGGSKQRNLLDGVEELCKREGKNAIELIALWHDAKEGKQLNGPQNGNSLLRWLQQRCRPLSSLAEREFDQFTQQLNMPDEATLLHTTAFEDDQITLTMRYPSKEKFLQQWPTISEALMAK